MTPHLMFITWSLPQLLIVLLLVFVLFGKGKVSDLMGDVAKGIKSFKKGLADDDVPSAPAQAVTPPKPLDHEAPRTEAAQTPAGTETKV
jgi:sec-independent protein translocase protein TatA